MINKIVIWYIRLMNLAFAGTSIEVESIAVSDQEETRELFSFATSVFGSACIDRVCRDLPGPFDEAVSGDPGLSGKRFCHGDSQCVRKVYQAHQVPPSTPTA